VDYRKGEDGSEEKGYLMGWTKAVKDGSEER